MVLIAHKRITRIRALDFREKQLQSELYSAQSQLLSWPDHSHLHEVIAGLKKEESELQAERLCLAAPY